jgi:hypothetical protein
VKAAVNWANTVYRAYGISSIAEAKPSTRVEIRERIKSDLLAMGIYHCVHEWWEDLE